MDANQSKDEVKNEKEEFHEETSEGNLETPEGSQEDEGVNAIVDTFAEQHVHSSVKFFKSRFRN